MSERAESTDAGRVVTGIDLESVLAAHHAIVSGDEDGWHVVCTCGYDERGTDSTAHVAAVLRDQIAEAQAEAWADGACYYGGSNAEDWYYNDGGQDENPYRAAQVAPSRIPSEES